MNKKASTRRYTKLCPELQRVVDIELGRGNRLSGPPEVTDWPEKGSVFASLEFDFKTRISELPEGITFDICTDPRFGWHGEYFCMAHKHLVVAGTTKK